MNIKDKIAKLLSLAGSPNENEARDALLKAKELMVKHKLTEADLNGMKSQTIKHVMCRDIKWTTDSGDIWMVNLCDLLCNKYLCTASWATPQGTRTHTLMITGMEDDANLCYEVVKYAVGFVTGAIQHLQRTRRNSDAKSVSKSYAQGFIMGLQFAFEEQEEDHPEWALVVSKPEEVKRYEDGLSSRSVRTRKTDFDSLSYLKGQRDGQQFNAQRVLTCQ